MHSPLAPEFWAVHCLHPKDSRAVCSHCTCATTVVLNYHLHQHRRNSSYSSAGMLNMLSTQDFLLKVTFPVRAGADHCLAGHSTPSSQHPLPPEHIRQTDKAVLYLTNEFRLSWHSITLSNT